jgi:DNA repair exonuclease SbcCD nuclease subunit
MPHSVILRFRDVTGDDPIRQHRQTISSAGYVWWGWWKKDFEPQRAQELEELRERARTKPLLIGLFDRSQRTYFSALLCDCIYSNGATPSPEPTKTPGYYSTEKVAAWFKFSGIETLDESEFITKFAAPPTGEGTFFPIWLNGAGSATRNTVSKETIRLSSPTILHLSDVHFGADYGFPTQTSPGRTPLIDLIEHDFQDEKPGLIVVSGDFTTRADANVLQDDGLRFLVALSERLRVPRENFVLVPGNHDIALKKWRPQDYSHENSFHLFVKEFYGQARSYPELRYFQLPCGRRMEVLAINSVRLRHESEKQFGYVQWPLYEDVLRTTLYDPETIRIAVLHHHLVPAAREETVNPDYPEASVSTTLDAGAVIDGLQKHGFTLALHGHQHVPAVTRVARVSRPNIEASNFGDLGKGLVVLAAGSAGASQSRLSDEMRDNSYNVVRFQNGLGESESRRYNPGLGPQTLLRVKFS